MRGEHRDTVVVRKVLQAWAAARVGGALPRGEMLSVRGVQSA
jgi:hypothetical protein